MEFALALFVRSTISRFCRCRADHGGIPITVAIGLGRLDQLLDLGLGQVLPLPIVGVGSASDCALLGRIGVGSYQVNPKRFNTILVSATNHARNGIGVKSCTTTATIRNKRTYPAPVRSKR